MTHSNTVHALTTDTIRASGDPVAELFNERRDRVGIVFKWNTGEEQVRWSIPWENKEPDAREFLRVDLPT